MALRVNWQVEQIQQICRGWARDGELAQVVERSLSMWEVPGSIPGFSKLFTLLEHNWRVVLIINVGAMHYTELYTCNKVFCMWTHMIQVRQHTATRFKKKTPFHFNRDIETCLVFYLSNIEHAWDWEAVKGWILFFILWVWRLGRGVVWAEKKSPWKQYRRRGILSLLNFVLCDKLDIRKR